MYAYNDLLILTIFIVKDMPGPTTGSSCIYFFTCLVMLLKTNIGSEFKKKLSTLDIVKEF